MSEKKLMFGICGGDNLCEGYSCNIEKTEKGISISISSDDPEKVTRLQEKMTSCCEPSDDKSSCC